MFDTRLRPLLDPPLDRAGGWLGRHAVRADAVTLAGLGFAVLAAAAIVLGWWTAALIAIVANRIADGLDGAVARATGSSPMGGYYDVVFDVLFYGAVPLAFALHDPAANALAAAVLLASFYANGATFLAFAAVAATRGLTTEAQGRKAIYYFAGLAEGAETIAAFVLMVIVPTHFAAVATAFALLCFASAGARILMVRDVLAEPTSPAPAPQRRSRKNASRSAADRRSSNPP